MTTFFSLALTHQRSDLHFGQTLGVSSFLRGSHSLEHRKHRYPSSFTIRIFLISLINSESRLPTNRWQIQDTFPPVWTFGSLSRSCVCPSIRMTFSCGGLWTCCLVVRLSRRVTFGWSPHPLGIRGANTAFRQRRRIRPVRAQVISGLNGHVSISGQPASSRSFRSHLHLAKEG